jgi:MFS family permease
MLGILSRPKSKRVYPRQFWLLFWGVFANRASFSMVWPFLTIYLTQEVGLALVTVTLLISARSFSSLFATLVVAPLMDRFGRKQGMIAGLAGSAMLFVAMAFARDLPLWLLIMVCHGIVMPLFNIGVYAMVADSVEEAHRANAYALIRVVANAGIAVGPIVGGLVILASFGIIFILTAAVFVALAALIHIFITEVPRLTRQGHQVPGTAYGFLLRDRVFMGLIVAFFFTEMATTHMFTLLNVYVINEYGLLPGHYSLLVTINAVMVVLFQVPVTRITARFAPFLVLALGAFVYALGIFSVAVGSQFAHFALSMVVVTVAELIVSPTVLTLVARMAPLKMRARYLGVMELIYPVASGVGPVIGGYLSDYTAPVMIWVNAGFMTLIGAFIFCGMAFKVRKRPIGGVGREDAGT